MILIDLPPILVTDDALVVAPKIDAVLVVASEGSTSRSELEKALQLVSEFPVAGVVLNRASETSADYNYAYEADPGATRAERGRRRAAAVARPACTRCRAPSVSPTAAKRVSMRLYDRSRARRSLFDTIAYRVLSQVTTVLGYIVLVRAMSKADFGVFNLLYSFIPLVGTLASLGLEQTLRRFQPEYLRQDKLAAAAWLVKRVATARLATNCVLLGRAAAGLEPGGTAFRPGSPPGRVRDPVRAGDPAFPEPDPAAVDGIAHAAPLQRRLDRPAVVRKAGLLLDPGGRRRADAAHPRCAPTRPPTRWSTCSCASSITAAALRRRACRAVPARRPRSAGACCAMDCSITSTTPARCSSIRAWTTSSSPDS